MICFGFGGQCTVVGVGAPVEPRVPGVAIGELVWHEAGAVELEPSRPCELPVCRSCVGVGTSLEVPPLGVASLLAASKPLLASWYPWSMLLARLISSDVSSISFTSCSCVLDDPVPWDGTAWDAAPLKVHSVRPLAVLCSASSPVDPLDEPSLFDTLVDESCSSRCPPSGAGLLVSWFVA